MTRVLVVDDNNDNRYLLRVLLQGQGWKVVEASQGADALIKARANPPDLVVSDLLMPILDGYTLLRRWREDSQLRGIPFVVYTATYTEPRDERLALALGADAFVIKPAEPEDLMTRIQDVMARHALGKLPSVAERPLEEAVLLREYNEVLIRKLEQKVQQLEQSNRELVDEIGERKRSEEAIRLRDRAIQAVSQGILMTDPKQPDNPIVYASGGFERMTGYAAAEVLGRNCRFMQGKDTDREQVARLRTAIAAGGACAVELLNYRKDGTPFWNALSLNPVRGETGELAYFVGVQSDITERRKLEDQLRQSQKMEAVGRLAGGVAHDFNNLLTIISSYGELILEAPGVDETVREFARGIFAAGERASALTRQLLGFSRQSMLQPEVLDLNSVVTETGKLLRRLIGENIVLTTVLAPNLSPVKVDPSQLDQVLMNLVVNARDAMPDGGKLTIEAANVDLNEAHATSHIDCKGGPHVMLAITDTGCGMTPDILARIFDPFFTTKPVGSGTGLGLPMVLGIVQQSGGCIQVHSEPGHGSAFRIYLPAVSEPVTKKVAAAPKLATRGTERVLLVEDDEGVREVAMESLQLHGYKVLAATDGEDALKIARAHREPLDLLLTDVVMPNISASELATQLQALFPRIKVLFMSGYTEDSAVRQGLLEAAVSFIQKPYTPQSLARKVREVLDEGQDEAK